MWLKLTKLNGQALMIRSNDVYSFERVGDGETYIVMTHGEHYRVKETIDEIYAVLCLTIKTVSL